MYTNQKKVSDLAPSGHCFEENVGRLRGYCWNTLFIATNHKYIMFLVLTYERIKPNATAKNLMKKKLKKLIWGSIKKYQIKTLPEASCKLWSHISNLHKKLLINPLHHFFTKMGEMLVFLIILVFRATLHHNHKFPTFFRLKHPVTPAANEGPLIVMSLLAAAVLTHSVERSSAERWRRRCLVYWLHILLVLVLLKSKMVSLTLIRNSHPPLKIPYATGYEQNCSY